jgi:hypothetical protein
MVQPTRRGDDQMPAWLSRLGLATGVACAAIGVLHVVTGAWSVPGEGGLGATVDNRERFYGAVFLGYGLAWIWAVRSLPRPRPVLRALALVLLLGGLARLLSVAVHGQPHWFQSVLTVVELLLPLAFLVPVRRSRASAPAEPSPAGP